MATSQVPYREFNSSISAESESTLGYFQGDSLSGNLFTLSLAAAINHLRAVLNLPNPPISEHGMVLEFEYADTVDFMDEEIETLQHILRTTTKVLKEWNLYVNEDKAEFTHVYLTNKGELLKPAGKPLVDGEDWRTNKTLGSLLCSTQY